MDAWQPRNLVYRKWAIIQPCALLNAYGSQLLATMVNIWRIREWTGLSVTLMKMSQRKCFIATHEALLHNMLVKPSLAETQFWVKVKRLKCVKYELDKISSSVDTLPFRWPDKDHVFLAYWIECTPLEGIPVWESFSRIRWSHTRTASPRVWTTLVVVCFWLLATWGSVGFYRQLWAVIP